MSRVGNNLTEDQTKIFDVHFGFNNKSLLDKLEARADALKDGDFDRLKLAQKDMTRLKNSNLEKLCYPNFMWVTFEHGLGF